MNEIKYVTQKTWDAFQKVKNHLLTQKEKSVKRFRYSDPICQYRGDTGTSCAIGCLIPNEIYTEDMEVYNSFRSLFECYPILKPYLKPLKIKINYYREPLYYKREPLFLGTILQEIHDKEKVENWEELLSKLEKRLKIYN